MTDLMVWDPCDPKAELFKVLNPEDNDLKGRWSGKSR